MPYVLSDNEYADFVEMRRLWLAGRDNGGNRSGPVAPPATNGRPGDRMAIVEITGDETGNEVYTCDAYYPATAFFSASTAPTAANLRGEAWAEDAVFINLQGIGQTGHALTDAGNTNQKFFVAYFIGVTTSDDRPVFIGNAFWTKVCA